MAAEEMMYCYRHPDRETGVSCSECGRGICPDCMVFAPVGIRCPDHSGVAQGTARVTTGVRRAAYAGTGALVTKTLIALNVLVFLANLAQGSSFSRTQGSIFENGALYIGSSFTGGLADGEWWRLITSAFLHAGLFHLGLNMLVLWFVGAPVEQAIGRGRYLALYIVSGLAGSAGALLFSPDAVTVGASGAIFGILGAALVLEAQGSLVLGGQAFGLIAFNLVLTFVLGSTSNISIGGHLGGLAGGALAMLALSRFGRTHAIYGRPGLLGVIGLIAVGAGAVLVAYLRVQGATA
jgi:membrane associated rhomboid family serine protease